MLVLEVHVLDRIDDHLRGDDQPLLSIFRFRFREKPMCRFVPPKCLLHVVSATDLGLRLEESNSHPMISFSSVGDMRDLVPP